MPVTGLILEAGKKYVLRDGNIIGPMVKSTQYPDRLLDGFYWWNINGLYGAFEVDPDHPKHVVKEWEEETKACTAEEAKAHFLAGERIYYQGPYGWILFPSRNSFLNPEKAFDTYAKKLKWGKK